MLAASLAWRSSCRVRRTASARPDLFTGRPAVVAAAEARRGRATRWAAGPDRPDRRPRPRPPHRAQSPDRTTPGRPPPPPRSAAGRRSRSAPPGPGSRTACAGPWPRRSWPADLNPSPDEWQTTADQRRPERRVHGHRAEDPDSCTFGNRKGPEIIVYGDSIGFPLLATVEKAYGKTLQGARHDQDRLRRQRRRRRLRQGRVGGPLRQPPADGARLRAPGEAEGPHHDRDLLVGGAAQVGAPRARRRKEWLAADQEFVDSVRRRHGRHRRPSMPGVAFLDCYRPGGSPGRCTTGIRPGGPDSRRCLSCTCTYCCIASPGPPGRDPGRAALGRAPGR